MRRSICGDRQRIGIPQRRLVRASRSWRFSALVIAWYFLWDAHRKLWNQDLVSSFVNTVSRTDSIDKRTPICNLLVQESHFWPRTIRWQASKHAHYLQPCDRNFSYSQAPQYFPDPFLRFHDSMWGKMPSWLTGSLREKMPGECFHTHTHTCTLGFPFCVFIHSGMFRSDGMFRACAKDWGWKRHQFCMEHFCHLFFNLV